MIVSMVAFFELAPNKRFGLDLGGRDGIVFAVVFAGAIFLKFLIVWRGFYLMESSVSWRKSCGYVLVGGSIVRCCLSLMGCSIPSLKLLIRAASILALLVSLKREKTKE
jgi:hypothetical protein